MGLFRRNKAPAQVSARQFDDLAGYSYAAICGDLNTAFHVGKYSDIPDAEWATVTTWFQRRIDTTER